MYWPVAVCSAPALDGLGDWAFTERQSITAEAAMPTVIKTRRVRAFISPGATRRSVASVTRDGVADVTFMNSSYVDCFRLQESDRGAIHGRSSIGIESFRSLQLTT